LSVKEPVDILNHSKQAIHAALNQLLESSMVEKFGRASKTIYRLKGESISEPNITNTLKGQEINFLQHHFLQNTESGDILTGIEAFSHWCKQRQLPFMKTADEYIKTLKKYQKYQNKDGLISGMKKSKNTKGHHEIHMNDLYYLDFYAIERFEKTRLGTLLHFAKQGQNKFLMKILMDEIKAKMETLIATGKYDAVGFVPPTIRREVQIMKYIETHLKINLPKIRIQKISGIIPVPQKSLHKIEERITNAENTFAISENIKYKHLLLIDDAVGSGSTLNQIARKIKTKGNAKKVTGLAVVGSFREFDAITAQ